VKRPNVPAWRTYARSVLASQGFVFAAAAADVLVAAAVFAHAARRGRAHPAAWGAAVLVLLVVALPAYLVLALLGGEPWRA
jgi:hypothetical protein